MKLIQYLANKFYSKIIGSKRYVEHEPFIHQFKSQKGRSKTSISQFVELNSLDYIMVDTDGNLVDKTITDYHYRKYKILISIDSIINSEHIAPLIQKSYAEDVSQHVVQVDTNVTEASICESTDTEPSTNVESDQYNLIELTDEEAFRDTNDNPVNIEVRGVRTENGILFRAKDIGKYLGMDNLLIALRDKRGAYKKDIHWIKLHQYSDTVRSDLLTSNLLPNDSANESTKKMTSERSDLLRDESSPNDSTNESTEKPIWSRTYLTLAGLLKVIFSSTSANENIMQLHNWIIHLVFVHKFGSPTERMDLVETLTPYKKCLNKLSGIYLIRIGKVKDLRKSMNISNDLYPDNKFDNACVFKFGRSDDIMTRFKQHCDRTGYGKYSDSISLEWFVVIPPKLCSNAESDLSKYFDLHQFKFAFSDGSKDHTELIIVKPGTEKKHIKDKYFELVKNFPGDANAIIEQMTQIKLDRDQLIDRMNLQHENELLKVQHQLEILTERSDKKDLTHHIELLTERSDKKDLAHQVEILQLKLELASLK
jgi:hypothetical protein